MPRRKKKPEEGIHIEFGFGELFKGLGSFIELLEKLAEEGKELRRTGEVTMPGKTKAMYGFSIKVGLGGEPVIERFGNVRETEAGAVVEEVREPLVDILDEGDHLRVIAELPGVEESDIKVNVKGDVLSIEAKSAERSYAKETLLPCKVNAEGMTFTYRNGVLDVKLPKS